MVSVCCVQLSAIHKHLDEMDERLDTMQNEAFLPHGDQAVADDDANNNSGAGDDSLLRDYDDMVTISYLSLLNFFKLWIVFCELPLDFFFFKFCLVVMFILQRSSS